MYLLKCQHKETENFYNSANKKNNINLIKKWIHTMWCKHKGISFSLMMNRLNPMILIYATRKMTL